MYIISKNDKSELKIPHKNTVHVSVYTYKSQ